MTSPRPPRLALLLLTRFAPDNDALIGDLLEAWPERSTWWFWRQTFAVILIGVALPFRANPRLTIESLLLWTAMLALLGFQAVVVSDLATHLLAWSDGTWLPRTGRFQGWERWFDVASVLIGFVVGNFIGRVRRDHVAAAMFGWAASVTAMVLLRSYLFVPNAFGSVFFPHFATQTALAALFVAALLVGSSWRSTCEPLPSR